MDNAVRMETMERLLREALPVEALELVDESHLHVGHVGHGGAGHFSLFIVSEAFAGKGRVQRHQLVYKILAQLMGREIHALAIVAKTSKEAGYGS